MRTNLKTIIIAEVGVNHNGSIQNARKLINIAAKAKANFVKFQSFKANNLVVRKASKASYQLKATSKKETQYQMLQNLELNFKDHEYLLNICRKKNIRFLSSPFDLENIKLLSKLNLNYFKIPSGEITNLTYLEEIGKLKKTIFLSTGMSTLKEINTAVNILTKNGTKKNKIYVLHCNTQYPTPFHDVNLNAMITIKEKINIKVGFSDHTLGAEVAIAAVSMGACVIEKHITLDRNMNGPDHKTSMTANDFINFVKSIRNVEKARGSSTKKPSQNEIKNLKSTRKSIYAANVIKKGEYFTRNNLIAKRPSIGISPMRIYELYGKKSKLTYKKDDLIKL